MDDLFWGKLDPVRSQLAGTPHKGTSSPSESATQIVLRRALLEAVCGGLAVWHAHCPNVRRL